MSESASFLYRLSGLQVRSELELTGLQPLEGEASCADVSIRLGRVPEELADVVAKGPNWRLGNGRLLLVIPRVGRFLIEDGRAMAVELAPGAAPSDAAAFLPGRPWGLLLRQRGVSALDGAVVVRNGLAIALVGGPSAGKSTLAAGLCRDGFQLVCDEIAAIAFEPNGAPKVLPEGPMLRLWRPSIEALGLADSRCGAVRPGFEKFHVRPKAVADEPAHLEVICQVDEAPPPDIPRLEPVPTPDAMRLLFASHGGMLIEHLPDQPRVFRQAAAILARARVYRLSRPDGFDHLDAVLGLFRAKIETGWA